MRRWHDEMPLMLARWRAELRKHGLDPAPYVGAYLRGKTIRPTVCHCETGPGAMRKRRPWGCGRARCGVCHPHKKWKKGRWAREYRALTAELLAS